MTAEEAKVLADTAVSTLTQDPEQWRRWATTLSRFHEYSLGNTLLIMTQRPEATRVAGYRSWQALGRQVSKGEHGITILAPLVGRRAVAEVTAEAEAASPEAAKPPVIGFRPATVFDIAQTQGRALEIPHPTPLRSHDLADVLQHLVSHAVPVPVHMEALDDPETHGYWSPRERRIVLAEGRAPDQQLKTLLHEWSHSVGVPDAEAARGRHQGQEEIVAETTAFVMAQRLGLDTRAYSMGYVASWADADPKRVLAAAQDVAGRVRSLGAAMERAAEHDPVLAQATASWRSPTKSRAREYEAEAEAEAG